MKRCAIEKNAMVYSDSVVCPKPRRCNDHFRLLRCNNSELNDMKAGAEMLDIILSKGSGVEISANQVASSPPFFSGSPPRRVSNPLVQDEQFCSDNSKTSKTFSPVRTFSASPSPSPSPSGRSGGCVRAALGQNSVAVRIEGFDCLSRDRQNCSISAVA